jgi:8-oxo-dGTP diphosphatase
VDSLSLGPYSNDIFQAEGLHYVTLFAEAQYCGGTPEVLEPQK